MFGSRGIGWHNHSKLEFVSLLGLAGFNAQAIGVVTSHTLNNASFSSSRVPTIAAYPPPA